jgi:hypothetical protein
MKKIILNERCYFLAASCVVGLYVGYMHFMFNSSLADSEGALRITHWMAKLIPAIGGLPREVASSGNYWGLFFSLFWISTPIYWLLGYLGAPLLSQYRYQKAVTETTVLRVICFFMICTLGIVFAALFPIFNGMWVVNQVSEHFLILLLSWWYMATVIYYQALALRVLIMKLNRNQNL